MSSWFKSWANILVDKIIIHYSEELRSKFDATQVTLDFRKFSHSNDLVAKDVENQCECEEEKQTVVKVKVLPLVHCHVG